MKPLTIVTGGCERYGYWLICHIYDHYIHNISQNNTTLVVYDLGLGEHYRDIILNLSREHPWLHFETLNYSKYPGHVQHVADGYYAWKIAIFQEVCKKYSGAIMWLDSGMSVTDQKYYQYIKDKIYDNTILSVRSVGNIYRWCHPGTLSTLDFKHSQHLPMRASGSFGCNYGTNHAINFVDELYHWSMLEHVITPPGSNRKNHRQEQSILTILYYNYKYIHNFPDIDIMHHIAGPVDKVKILIKWDGDDPIFVDNFYCKRTVQSMVDTILK